MWNKFRLDYNISTNSSCSAGNSGYRKRIITILFELTKEIPREILKTPLNDCFCMSS